jgi:hypothetical protein
MLKGHLGRFAQVATMCGFMIMAELGRSCFIANDRHLFEKPRVLADMSCICGAGM